MKETIFDDVWKKREELKTSKDLGSLIDRLMTEMMISVIRTNSRKDAL